MGLLVLLTRLPGLVSSHTFNTDEATLGVGGRALRSGGSLYVDVIDRKPPLPFAAYAVFGTEHLQMIRFVVALLVLGAAWLCADEAKRRWGSNAGWVAGLIVVLGAAALGPADAQAANFELFALFPIVVAVVAAARGLVGGGRGGPGRGGAVQATGRGDDPAGGVVLVGHPALARAGTGLAAGAVTGVVLAAPFGLANVIEALAAGEGGYLAFDPADLGFLAVRLLAVVAIAAGFWAGAWLLLVGGRTAQPAPAMHLSADGDGADMTASPIARRTRTSLNGSCLKSNARTRTEPDGVYADQFLGQIGVALYGRL